MQVQSLPLLSGSASGIAMNCSVGGRGCPDLKLLWQWPAAVALIRPLGWELPYASGTALKKKKKQKKKKKNDLIKKQKLQILLNVKT